MQQNSTVRVMRTVFPRAMAMESFCLKGPTFLIQVGSLTAVCIVLNLYLAWSFLCDLEL